MSIFISYLVYQYWYKANKIFGLRVISPLARGCKSHPARLDLHPLPLEEYLRQSLRETTVPSYLKRLKVLGKLGSLNKPNRMKTLICTYPVSEGRKGLLADAYDYYVQWKGLTWIKPKFVREDKPIFVPLEKELDQLIANAYEKMSVFLEMLRECGMNSGEAWKLRWIDINTENKTVGVRPTKNHNARTLPISGHLLSRLLRLPHENDRVFGCRNLDKFRYRYERIRNALSKKLDNPRIYEIAFRSFRHWKATIEYQKTKDILHVKWLLGHKRIENTLVYTHLVNFGSDDYICKVAHTVDECTLLIENGFEYVTEMDGMKLFRKRK